MQPLSIVLFALGAMLLLIALIVYRGDMQLIRSMRFKQVKVKDEKAYAAFLGKSLALAALSPILAGVAGLFLPATVAAILFPVTLIAALVIIVKRAKRQY